jgi:hypothetical protein
LNTAGFLIGDKMENEDASLPEQTSGGTEAKRAEGETVAHDGAKNLMR